MRNAQQHKPKILIVGIHGEYQPWLEIFQDGQRQTWMADSENTKIVNAFGSPIRPRFRKIDEKIYYLRWSSNRLIAYGALLIEAALKTALPFDKYRPEVSYRDNENLGEFWRIEMCDSLLLQGVKNVAVFRNALNFDFDYLVTTITSSYLNLHALEEYLSVITAPRFVGGRIEQSGNLTYQQGSFRVYSRNVVLDLVKNSKKYRHWKIEDIAMGNLTSLFEQKLTSMPNRTLQSVQEVELLTLEDLKSTISYRCKATEKGRRVDSEIMRLLHHRIMSIQ
jgi:hypothetical protein